MYQSPPWAGRAALWARRVKEGGACAQPSGERKPPVLDSAPTASWLKAVRSLADRRGMAVHDIASFRLGAAAPDSAAVERLRELLERAPLVSPAAIRLMALLSGPEPDAELVAEIVQTDPQLSSAVLKVAASVVFWSGTEVRSLQQAIVRLGSAEVMSVTMRVSATPAARAALALQPGLADGFWAHSLCTAFAARQLARNLPGKAPLDLAYTAGLLHDVGRPAIAVLADENGRTLPPFQHGQRVDLAGEGRLAGIDHARAGWELLRGWGLPVELGVAVLHHHRPQLAPLDARPLATLVQLADRLAHRALLELGRSDASGDAAELATAAELRGQQLQRIVESVKREFHTLGSRLAG